MTPEGRADQHPATTGHGRSAPDACSSLWDRDGTSAFGTAALARFFVALEQPGPWGRQAATESRLNPRLGAELDRRCAGLGGRFMLIRRPSTHADHSGPQRVLLGHSGAHPGDSWLIEGDLASAGDLLSVDWLALLRGHRDVVRGSLAGAHDGQPALLICTNGRRDVCCAVRGRPLATAAAAVAPERVWEVSHTGGHRFAPTAVLLPWGQTYARLDPGSVEWVLEASLTGHTPRELLGPVHDRGRSALNSPVQAAESFVRHAIGETHLASLWARETPGGVEAAPGGVEAAPGGVETAPGGVDDAPEGAVAIHVQHADGRHWRVAVTRTSSDRVRPESCGKSAVPVFEQHVTVLSEP